ncbi:unnamed protein product [Staurois parvus]|uniref:Uncharacterized protein n=1 Tax=Staurois parvus TaxID=386267 RepID=A0ABN9GR92_9NEOB|nr:unnamed protein product [Staurois parvus]
MYSLQPGSPAILYPWHLKCGHPAVTACGFTAGFTAHCPCASSTEHCEWSCSPQGPVVFHKTAGGGGENLHFRSPRLLQQKWEQIPVKIR